MYTLPLRLPLLVTRTSNDVSGVWDRVLQDYRHGTQRRDNGTYLTISCIIHVRHPHPHIRILPVAPEL